MSVSTDTTLRDARLFIESAEKAMRVLEIFHSYEAFTVAEVARLTGIGRSAAQRFIYTWQMMGYIRKVEGTKGYVLTPRVLAIANQYYRTHDLLKRAYPYLVESGRRSEERVGFGELDDTDYVLLYQTPSIRSSDLLNPVGTRYPAYLATSGLAIMAHMPREEVAGILARTRLAAVTEHTITDPARLYDLLDEVRAKGYCITEQLSSYGRISVSAPVLGAGGRAVAAINISTLLVRYTRQTVEAELMPIAFETARTISSIIRDS